MKKLLSLLSASALAATTLFSASLFQPVQEVTAADQVKIMPVGDSITNGDGETGGYRKYLDYALKQKGISFDMVGPKKDMNASFSYNGQTVQYDSDHAGFSGFQIKEVPDWGKSQGNTGSLYNELKNNDAVKKYQPDIILLIIGTNDMTANRSMSACSSDLHDLVDYMLGDMPAGGTVFMGSIPEHTAYGGNPEKIANYNNTVKSVAEEYEKAGKNVHFADVHGCLNGTADLGFDNLHPNGTGYEKMGKFWAGVIEDYLGSGSSTVTTTVTTGGDGSETTTTTPTNPVKLSGSEILHADFESGLSGWTARGSATVAVSKDEAESGSQSASVSGRTNAWNGISYDISSLVSSGDLIGVSAKVKQKSGSAVKFKLTVQYGSGNGAEYDTFAEQSVASGEWGTIAEANYTVKSGSSPVLYIETDTDTSDFFVDEVIITGKPKPVYKLGDVNGDGGINGTDLSLAKMGAAGKLTNSSQKKMADVNCDGSIDHTDLDWFVQFLTGQVKELPEPLTPPKGEMRSIEEYTPVVKDQVLEKEANGSTQRRNGVTYSEVKKYKYHSKKANKDKNVNVMLPPNYDESKEYPVLYVLHGFFENEDRMILTGNNPPIPTREIICNAWADGDAVDMIVVVPFVFTSATMNDATGFADAGSNEGYDNFVDDIVDSLMPWVEENFSVAKGRENTAVTGFSMGGRESLQIGMKYGDKFGYVGAICPAPGASGAWKWSSAETTPSLVFITGGTADDVVGLNTPQGYHDNFDKNGVPHIWHVINGGHHGDDSICAHIYNFVRAVFKA